MRARTKKRGFLSAVVVTIAAGCGGADGGGGTSGEEQCCHNPPPIFTFEGLAVGDSVRRDEHGLCNQFVAATSSTKQVECPPGLESAGTIRRDGEACTIMPDVRCPPPSEATCNPPPPQPIPCPAAR